MSECLNLRSQRWQNFTRSRVRYIYSLRIVALKNAISSRSDELKMLFLEELELAEFRIARSSLFYSIMVEVFLKWQCSDF